MMNQLGLYWWHSGCSALLSIVLILAGLTNFLHTITLLYFFNQVKRLVVCFANIDVSKVMKHLKTWYSKSRIIAADSQILTTTGQELGITLLTVMVVSVSWNILVRLYYAVCNNTPFEKP